MNIGSKYANYDMLRNHPTKAYVNIIWRIEIVTKLIELISISPKRGGPPT